MKDGNIIKEINKALAEVETEYVMGGLSSGLYADYARDVSLRVIPRIIKEAQIELIRDILPEKETIHHEFPVGWKNCRQQIITNLKKFNITEEELKNKQ